MKSKPKVTILSAAYNHEPYLSDFFTSIAAQDYSNIELIFSDDASTDSSSVKIEEIERFAGVSDIVGAYNRAWDLTIQPKNLGIWGNAIYLVEKLRQSDSKYVCLLEADDYIRFDRISKQVEFLENSGYQAVHSNCYAVDKDGKPLGRVWNTQPSGNVRKQLEQGNFIMTCSFMTTRELFLEHYNYKLFHEQENLFFGDYGLFLSLSKNNEIAYMDECLATYRILNDSASHAPKHRPAMVESTLRYQELARKGII